MADTKHILIVWHSQSGRNARMKDWLSDAASAVDQVLVRCSAAPEAGLADLRWADGVIFVGPEYLGHLSGGMKDFFDRTFYPAQEYQLNLPYVQVISSGNDGSNAERELDRIALGYPLRKVNDSLIWHGELSDAAKVAAEELGEGFATGLQMGIFG